MNQHGSIAASVVSADDISRRAYELWEQEGRPEGCDLRHWLQAEQELAVTSSNGGLKIETAPQSGTMTTGVRSTIGGRATPVVPRGGKRGSASPFGGDKSAAGNGQASGRRKSASSPTIL